MNIIPGNFKSIHQVFSKYRHICKNVTYEPTQHEKCLVGEESCCCWQQSGALNTISCYRHDHLPLPSSAAEAVFPIYTDPSDKNDCKSVLEVLPKTTMRFIIS